ncbi:hypothetical protein NVP1054O_55 [Vibrio phage 1.054.O._10N.261.52.A1]|nr:hypothetical protein NVP1054O_55 [Vibrio phage 1.054.O._10N.261.52.A1]
MKNKKAKQMMIDVAKHVSIRNGNDKCDDKMWIAWLDGPCLMTASANFMWLYDETVSLTANQLRGSHASRRTSTTTDK